MRKLYCYVDEHGQHSYGAYFLVSVVIAEDDRDQLEAWLVSVEKETGKNRRKWNKAGDKNRSDYIRAVLKYSGLKGRLFTSHYVDTRDYVGSTIDSTAQAIQAYTREEYKATILIDGLKRQERNRFSSGLRQYGISTQKVVGRDDQKDPFIRLADALCGFVADANEGRQEYRYILDKVVRDGILKLL